MKTVSAIISGREPYSVTLGTNVFDVIQLMASKNIGAICIVDSSAMMRLRGVFSERDLLKRVVLQGLDPRALTIETVMTKNVAVASAGESYDVCMERMKRVNSRHLPVVEGEKFLGMISVRDLLETNLEEKDAELKMMNAYIHDMPATV